jgi:DNA transposition AAA+ family ATPase
MKYLLKRRTPYNGKIIPAQTVLPSKKYPMIEGQVKQKFLNKGWLVEIDESKIKIVRKDNHVELLEKMEQENQAEAQEKSEAIYDVSDDNLDNMKMDELKALAKEKGIKYVAVKKEQLIQNLREVL